MLRPQKKTERNNEILQRFKNGENYKRLLKAYKLSITRIYDILRQTRSTAIANSALTKSSLDFGT